MPHECIPPPATSHRAAIQAAGASDTHTQKIGIVPATAAGVAVVAVSGRSRGRGTRTSARQASTSSSGVIWMSRAICRRRIGEMSRPR